jgi:hypothetical protein
MDYFYDGQVKRYLTQFMRLMSNFSYKDAKGQIIEVPVRYGDMNRQVAQILNKNSENVMPSAPFIACYIKDLQHDRSRMQDPTYVSKVNIRERDNRGQGAGYTVERLMPTPYLATFSADIWTSNTDQKLQLWEQITVFFNPSLELQSTDNYIDWTSLSAVELTSQTFESRSIPQGLETDISICNLVFSCPIWISPPAKVKKLGIITKIISNVFVSASVSDQNTPGAYFDAPLIDLFTGEINNKKIVVTPGDFGLIVLNNSASLIRTKSSSDTSMTSVSDFSERTNWYSILDLYPGQFKAGLSQLRLMRPDGTEIIAYISLNPTDDFSMSISFDPDTVPTNTILNGRGSIDAIIDPYKLDTRSKVAGVRYLILEDINPEPHDEHTGGREWITENGDDLRATANDIIEWNGTYWTVIFNSSDVLEVTYITNSYTGIQYKWSQVDGAWQWSKSYEGIYDPGAWRLIL